MNKKAARASIALVCLILGIMLALQFKTTENINNNVAAERAEDLNKKLDAVTDERDILAEEVLSLRERLKNVRETDQAMKDLQEELQSAQLAACLLPIQGAGIILTLNDSAKALQPGENPNAELIHDTDLLTVINEIKASGAEAISINDKRIVAMSEIRCAGTTILVNWDKIAPPFVIKAIGNPDLLESSLNIKGGYLSLLKNYGMQVNLQKVENMEMVPYAGNARFIFATPVVNTEKRAE